MDSDETRQQLQQEAQRLTAIRDDVRSADEFDETGRTQSELSVVDQHPADVATEHQQREVDLSLLEQLEAELADIERALHKLDDGSYGRCEACGKQIDEPRLAAQPAARFCIEDQSRVSDRIDLGIAPNETQSPASPI